MHVIDLKLPESFTYKYIYTHTRTYVYIYIEREREKYEKQEQTICFFMSLSRSLSDISARCKIELWSTTAPFSHPDFLLQCSAIQIAKIGTKWFFTRTSNGWQATWYQTTIKFNDKFTRKYIFKKIDKKNQTPAQSTSNI